MWKKHCDDKAVREGKGGTGEGEKITLNASFAPVNHRTALLFER